MNRSHPSTGFGSREPTDWAAYAYVGPHSEQNRSIKVKNPAAPAVKREAEEEWR